MRLKGQDLKEIRESSRVVSVTAETDVLVLDGRCVAGDKMSHAVTCQMMCCAVTFKDIAIYLKVRRSC